jgi:uncharacterized protein
VESRQASTSSWFQGVSSWAHRLRPSRTTTDRQSSGVSGELADLSMLVRVALLLIRTYKLLISPYFRGSCRFLPSCADYASEAFRTHGFVAGSGLTLRRLARCHPLGGAGYDPVPPTEIGR